MFYREEYYDMRTGKPFKGELDLTVLKPFEKSNQLSFQSISNDKLRTKLESVPEKYHLVITENNISGNFPKYFFKGLIKMLS